MSQTADRIDAKSMLVQYIHNVHHLYLKDLSHIADDKLSVSPMGVARPPLEFTVECGGYNQMMAKMLKGEDSTPPNEEERAAFYAELSTREKATAFLSESVQALASALEGADDATLGEMQNFYGREMTKFQMCMSAATHMDYHLGQLNYIQALYGDADIHWGE